MKQLLNTLIMAIMLLTLAGVCLAAEEEASIEAAPPEHQAGETTPLVADRDAIDDQPDPILDAEDSSWSNVKALWG